ncbi:sialate O-acetylesterase [Hafnia alvei]|uniref:tail fiber/spike domain-containing protein n=1 Tax=Hafnia alvei TaxID=569 RepID=UPI000DF8ECEC|nr:sialate O-acetylesterase [Hafnia alvei]STQ71445.1 Uncharacterised protein [Hafnia alvei]STR94766.1 Uncharacterised protein [Hafnia alvei]
MATQPTNLPVPSESARDLKFNAGKIDEFVTSASHEYIDRFGGRHRTIAGINYESNQAMSNYGYITQKSFEMGSTLNTPNTVLQWESNGEFYRWDGDWSQPKVVPAGSTPDSTGGIGDGAWKSVGDATLRGDLSSEEGSSFVNDGDKTVAERISSLREFSEGNNLVNGNNTPIVSLGANNLISSSVAIVQTGQSLAEGGVGYDVSSLNQNTLNSAAFTLSGGPIGVGNSTILTKITNLKERVRATIGTTLTDGLLVNGCAKKMYFHGQAYGGMTYQEIKKGGDTGVYEKCIAQANNVKAGDRSVIYYGVTIIHGEQDGFINNTNYAANLSEWISNFNTDLKAITSQSKNVKGFLCQTATAGGYGFNGGITQTTFPTPLSQLQAHKTAPLLTLVCSKYHLKYYDHAHITNESQAILGEYYSKAMLYEVKNGTKFEPCRPISFSRDENKIIVTFTGVELGLSFDTENVTQIANMGFSYIDSAGNTIQSVAITSRDEVTITLSGVPSSTSTIAYAYHNGAGGASNQSSGLGDRGNLRGTSNDCSKVNGKNLHPWCVIFKETF